MSQPLIATADLDQPTIARIVNYVLGDETNFAADRAAADLLVEAAPSYPGWVRDNAGFQRRAVAHMLAAGIRQFLDLGAGMGSTRGSVLALASDAGVRVACVETDPVAVAHLHTFAQPGQVSVHEVDLLDPATVLHPDQVWRLLDPAEPVGVVLTSVLHHHHDATRIATALHGYHDALAAGSMLAATHLSADHAIPNELPALVAAHARLGFTLVPRDRDEMAELLGPWVPQPDGLVPPRLWRPEHALALTSTTHLGNAVLATRSSPPRL